MVTSQRDEFEAKVKAHDAEPASEYSAEDLKQLRIQAAHANQAAEEIEELTNVKESLKDALVTANARVHELEAELEAEKDEDRREKDSGANHQLAAENATLQEKVDKLTVNKEALKTAVAKLTHRVTELESNGSSEYTTEELQEMRMQV